MSSSPIPPSPPPTARATKAGTMIHSLVYALLVLWLHPRTADRVEELVSIAADVADTDATEGEARLLASIAVHESRATVRAVGDGGLSRGAWQVRGRDVSAAGALAKVRWSYRLCADLSAYAGCGRCGSCPAIVASLVDPTLPRR